MYNPYYLLEYEPEYLPDKKQSRSFESFSHLFAKQLLRQWILNSGGFRTDTCFDVWLEYPFFKNTEKFPYGFYYDETCGLGDCPGCAYRNRAEPLCVECSGEYPLFIADVVVGYKGMAPVEIWEVVNTNKLSDKKIKFYKSLRDDNTICYSDLYVIPDYRILKQVDVPDLNILRREHQYDE